MHPTEAIDGFIHTTVTNQELAIVDDATGDLVSRLECLPEYEFLDVLQSRAEQAKHKLPRLTELLGKLTARQVAVVVFDLPESTVKSAPSTPLDFIGPGELNLFAPDRFRGFLLGLGGLYGYGFTSQQDGVIHNNIMPIERLEGIEHISANARHVLGLHTEDASFRIDTDIDISPDVLSLHFFRNDEKVPTIIAIPKWDDLSPATIDRLSQPVFRNRTSYLQGGEDNNTSGAVPILFRESESAPWAMAINTTNIDYGKYEEAEDIRALRELVDHLNHRSTELVLHAGQIALIDNRSVAHGRAVQAFRPAYDGSDRWQRRMTAAIDPNRLKKYEVSPRVIDPQHIISGVA